MRRLKSERGGVAVFVAILLVVVFGMGALVVDVGQIYWERRQLQTGAEAAALAVAQDCVDGVLSCDGVGTDVLATAAQPYADLNSADGRSEVAGELLDGVTHAMPHGLDPAVCDPGGAIAPNPLATLDTVKVTTQTIDASNEASFITHVLGPVLGLDTKTVSACAVAMWGYAASLSTIPLVISTCEFDLAPETGTATVQYPGPHPNAGATQEKIVFHAGTGADDDPCNAQAGHDTDGDGSLPSGFGWIQNSDCQITTTVIAGDTWVDKEPGNDPACPAPDLASMLNTVIQIPVFNDFCKHPTAPVCPGTADRYRLVTYASFYLQGYKLGGPTYRGGDYSSCSGSESCIVGYFTTSTSLDGEIGGPPGGVKVVKLTG